MAQGAFELSEQGGVVRDPDGRTVVQQACGSTVAIAAAVATNTVIKASAGALLRVLVTATGTTAMNFYDNASAASGTIIGVIPANPTVGTLYTFNMPAANGIVAGGVSTNPGVTVGFS